MNRRDLVLAVAALLAQTGCGASGGGRETETLAFVRNGKVAFVNEDGGNVRMTGLTAFGFPVWSRSGRRTPARRTAPGSSTSETASSSFGRTAGTRAGSRMRLPAS